MNYNSEQHRNRIQVIERAANVLGVPFHQVAEAFDYQFKFIANHIANKGTETVLLRRLGKFRISGKYKGPETFDEVDALKAKLKEEERDTQ